uniref:DNA cross-link repair 1A protein n=1 Tax=Cacopsylla melanoneura TaxID=428564 RepID=A0A8D8Q041_9HEMI
MSKKRSSSSKKSSVSKIRPDSSELNPCPLCQIPLHFLRISGEMHLMRCEQNSWDRAKECPFGIECFSPDFHHYWDYTHVTLSHHRSLHLNNSKNSEEATDEVKESPKTPKKTVKNSPKKAVKESPKTPEIKLKASPIKKKKKQNDKRKHKVLSESDSDDDFQTQTTKKSETITPKVSSSQPKKETKKSKKSKAKKDSDNDDDSGVMILDTQMTSPIKSNTQSSQQSSSNWAEKLPQSQEFSQSQDMRNQIDNETGEVTFGHFLFSNSQEMFSNYDDLEPKSNSLDQKLIVSELLPNQGNLDTYSNAESELLLDQGHFKTTPTKPTPSQELKKEELEISPMKYSSQEYDQLPTPSKYCTQEFQEIRTDESPEEFFKHENQTSNSENLHFEMNQVPRIQFSDSSDDDCEVNSETGEMLYTEKFELDENSRDSIGKQQQVQDDPIIVSEDIKKVGKHIETIEAWKKILSNKQAAKDKERNAKEKNYSSYSSEPSEARYTSTDRAPFYKLIPDTDFVVDGFKNGPIVNKNNYFLTHFHYDHYIGLNKHFSKTIHCSTITAELLKTIIKIDAKYIREIDVGETKVINQVEVTALDANHCPGALMFVFKTLAGQSYLHVGDFRADISMQKIDILKATHFDKVYLDTTYCNPHYNFPAQTTVLRQLVQLVERNHEQYPNTLYICGSYTIGKEKVYISILEKMKWKIYVESSKRRILTILNDATINAHIVANAFEAKLHVIPMSKLNNIHHLMNYYESYQSKYDRVVAIKPTGWVYNEHNDNNINIRQVNESINIYEISYSEHSSFLELCTFVKFVKYKQIVCTVNVRNSEKQIQMLESHIKKKLGNANEVTNTLNSYFKK